MKFGINGLPLTPYIRLIRPLGSILIGLVTFAGQMIALKGLPELSLSFFSFSTSVFLTASSFVINDYLDVEIDRINRPNRPIPSGLVSKKSALYFGLTLFTLGSLSAIMINLLAMLLALFTFILSVLYSLYGKRYGLLGNMMVAYCVSIAFIFGSLSATESINLTVATLFTLSFFSNLGREVTQGIADMEGDRVKGVRSVAIVNGPRSAALFASACYSITALFGPIIFLYLFNKLDILRTLFVLTSEVGFFFSIIYLLREPTRDRALKTVRQVNLWMIMVLGAVTIIGLYL